MIIYAHLNLNLSAKPVATESPTAYKQLCNETVDNVVALKALWSPTKDWDDLLVPIILNRLDNVTKRSWKENKSSSADPSTFEEIKEFLRKKVITLEVMYPTSFSGNTQENCNSKDNQGRNFNHYKSMRLNSVKSHNITNPTNWSKFPCSSENGQNINSCGVCKGKG